MLDFALTSILWILALYGLIEIIKTIIHIHKYPKISFNGTSFVITVHNQENNLEYFLKLFIYKILKKEKGITLIALVVTIVVLLILAGVSINLVIGNNGIITKSKEARIVTRADNAEDEVELWKNNNYNAKNSNGSSESKNDMLQRLIDKKLVYEDEIDRNNEIITIKREDGTTEKVI